MPGSIVLAPGIVVLALGILGGGCSPDPGCGISGDGGLFVPQSRMKAIAAIRATRCEVFAPVVGCDAGGCFEQADAGFGQTYRVTARNPGTCTVTVDFTDGCGPEVFEFTFEGPKGSCCSPACARNDGQAISQSCDADAGP